MPSWNASAWMEDDDVNAIVVTTTPVDDDYEHENDNEESNNNRNDQAAIVTPTTDENSTHQVFFRDVEEQQQRPISNKEEASLLFTNVNPPGAANFTQWLDNNDDDPIVNRAVQRFMGPPVNNNNMVLQLKHLRREHLKNDKKAGARHGTVSYKLLDTPVWHNYTLSSIAQQPESRGHRRRPLLEKIRHFRKKLVPMRRRKSKQKDDLIRNFQQDTRFVTRIMLIAIGLVMSIVGFVVSQASQVLLQKKIALATSLQQQPLGGFGVFISMNLAFGLLAFVPVACFRPASAGSGIAEAKAVLNGIVLQSCTELTTALCKAISVIFASASSLPVALEGPMIFMGLCLGENSQRFLPKRSNYATLLKTDRFRRDLAAVGTACGVTSAFYAPIGGVVFAMEEGSSYWSLLLGWRSFAAACVTAIFSYVWSAIMSGFDYNSDSLGKFNGISGQTSLQPNVSFRLHDYFVFCLMGIVCGILGACWCEANRGLTVWRNKLKLKRRWKCVEVLVLVAITSTLMWWIPKIYLVCGRLDNTKADDEYFRQFGCPEGQYNHLATLLLNPPSSVGLNLLFWEPPDTFTIGTCVIAGTIYLLILLLLFGTPISMGIFIPLLYVGACYGRALGVWWNVGEYTLTYALVGLVAMLAGVARVLISITAIMVTTTGLPSFVTPFMVATLFARVTGKRIFGRGGIYDIILRLKGIPFLEEEPPETILYRGVRAQDIMSTSLVTLEPEERIGTLLEYLKAYPFEDFPLTDPSRGGTFIGIVTRLDILCVLSHKGLFFTAGDNSASKALRYEEMIHTGAPTLETVEASLTEDDLNMVVDLTPYVEIAHYTFGMRGSAERAFELFRTLGLRTLVVTGTLGRPVGVITRYDLHLLEEPDVDENRLARSRQSVATYDSIS